MKLKDLIKQNLTGELTSLECSLESLLEIELTQCSSQILDDLTELFYRVLEGCEDIWSYVDEDSLLKEVITQYGGEVTDWEQLDALASGTGRDYWYRNVKTNREVYANVDQGVVTMELCEDTYSDIVYGKKE